MGDQNQRENFNAVPVAENSNTPDKLFAKMQNVRSFTWSAPNPFGEQTAYILLAPTDASSAETLEELSSWLGLQALAFGGDIPWVGTDYLNVALKGPIADLGVGSQTWLQVSVSDRWTGNAIGRRYVVLAVGTVPVSEEMNEEQIATYIQKDEQIRAGLVRIRLRVTDS